MACFLAETEATESPRHPRRTSDLVPEIHLGLMQRSWTVCTVQYFNPSPGSPGPARTVHGDLQKAKFAR